MLFQGYFDASIAVLPKHDVLGQLGREYHGWLGFVGHGLFATPVWLAMLGVATAWYCYLKRPDIPGKVAGRFQLIYAMLVRKYGFDEFNDVVFASGARGVGRVLWRGGDAGLIDGLLVNGSARLVGMFAGLVRQIQSGYLYHYVFAMIIGLLFLLGYFVYR
jgi:NADH-quinone oxidoreductase subunit L